MLPLSHPVSSCLEQVARTALCGRGGWKEGRGFMRMAGFSLAAMLLSGVALADPPAAPAPAAAPAAAPAPTSTVPPLGGGNIFISPMGQPFHGRDGLSGAEE